MSNPTGLCLCGCGEQAPLCPQSYRKRGITKGDPMDYVHGHNNRQKPEGYVVEDRGYETPCHIWTGRVSTGAGMVWRDGRNVPAYRDVYETVSGTNLNRKIHVHHKCEVRMCIRFDHLEAVTVSQHRLRHFGISPQTVQAIIEAEGSQREIASRFGVSQGTVWRLKSGHRFK